MEIDLFREDLRGGEDGAGCEPVAEEDAGTLAVECLERHSPASLHVAVHCRGAVEVSNNR